jgi:hypothetical protein
MGILHRLTLTALVAAVLFTVVADEPMPGSALLPATGFGVGGPNDNIAGLRLTVRLDPERTVTLPTALNASSQLPGASTCGEALGWLVRRSAAPADIGRITLLVDTSRTVQITVRSIRVRLVTEMVRHPEGIAACSSSDWRERNATSPGDISEEIQIGDESFGVSVLSPGSVRSGEITDELFPGPPDLRLVPLTVRPGRPLEFPIVIVNPEPGTRQGVRLDVKIVVNGIPHAFLLGDASDAPLWLYASPPGGVHQQRLEWLGDTQAWIWNRQFDSTKAIPRPVPDSRLCRALAIEESRALLGEGTIWVDGGDRDCSWSNRDTGEYLRLNWTRYPSQAEAAQNFRNRRAAMPITYPKASIVPISAAGDEAVNIAHFVFVYHGAEYVEFSWSRDVNSENLETYASVVRSVTKALWPA